MNRTLVAFGKKLSHLKLRWERAIAGIIMWFDRLKERRRIVSDEVRNEFLRKNTLS